MTLALSHLARKRFGQHFLIDEGVIDAIVQAINPHPHDVMVEIGPGLGAMTLPILQHLRQLHIVELDRDLAQAWRGYANQKIVVHEADALQFNFADVLSSTQVIQTNAVVPARQRSLRVIGNLPYNISTPLLFHLMTVIDDVQDQHFMLQKEVVERMAAHPGNKQFGRLSVMLQARYAISHLFNVPPAAFDPPPRVDSAIVRMIPLKTPLVSPRCQEAFAEVVTAAFSQRRKMLRNTLAAYEKKIDFASLNFDLTRRAEDVSVEEYAQLATALA